MILREALRRGAQRLAAPGFEEASLEIEALLGHLLGWSRAQLYAHLDEEIPFPLERRLARWLRRRLSHEPLAYITHYREFFGLDFYVNRHVLIPRPESEMLVEKALEWVKKRFASLDAACLVADVGTGCGALAMALALHLPQARLYAIDSSLAALRVAARNLAKYRLRKRARLLHGDWLAPLPEPVDLLVANLPYVRESDWAGLAPEIRLFEPKEALVAGEDGLGKIWPFLAQAGRWLRVGGALFLEIGQGQGEAVLEIARSHFPCACLTLTPDLAGIPRVLGVETDPRG